MPAIIALVFAAVFTNLLSPDQYGHYSLVLSVTAIFSTLGSKWLDIGVGRFLPETIDEVKRAEIRSALVTGLLAIVAIILALLPFPLTWMANDDTWGALVWPATFLSIGTVLVQPALVVLQVEMKASRYSLYQIALPLCRLVLSLVLVKLVSPSASVLVWAIALSTLFLLPFIWSSARLRVSWEIEKSMPYLKRFASYGLPMIGWSSAAYLLNIGDRWVIQTLRGSAEVGIYAANYALTSGGAGLVTAPVLLAMHPFLMRAWGRGDKVSASWWLATLVEVLVLCSAIFIISVNAFSKDIANWILGSEYRSGHIIMPWVLAGALAWHLGMYVQKPLEFAGRTRTMLVLSLVSAFINIVLNLLVVPKFGYVGAAYTTLGSYLTYVLGVGFLGHRVLPWKVSWTRLVSNGFLILGIGWCLEFVRPALERSWGYSVGLAGAVLVVVVGSAIVGAREWSALRREYQEVNHA